MHLSLELPKETETLLIEEAGRTGKGVGEYVSKVLTEHLKPGESSKNGLSEKRPDVLTAEETALFKVINKAPSEKFWTRFKQLVRAREEETITEAELAEFIRMNDRLERQHGKRLQAVVELAKIQGISFDELMTKMGLWNAAYF